MKYLDIYVMISPARGENFEVSAKSAAGGEGNSELKLPFRLGDLPTSIFGASSLNRGMSVGEAPSERLLSVEMVGVQLFDALFSGETREVLSRTEDVAKRNPEKTGVRIRLSMNLAAEGMAEVASLPWELMRRRNQNPLVVSVNTPVVRAFDTAIPVYLQPLSGKLKILLLVSNPKNTAPLNLSGERAGICKIWDGLDNVEYTECRPEAQTILDTLSSDEFHIVHYMGHGNFDSGSGGQVIMEDAAGREQPISGSTFATWLQDEPLRMVFLNACNTGTTGEQHGLHPFAGVASSLIGSGVPSVVAMQFPISDGAAIVFAETFYKRIAQGLPVEQAVSEGRKALLDRKGSEWATPVLYMRAANGDLFDRSSDKSAPATDTARPLDVTTPAWLPQQEFAEPQPARPWYKKPFVLGGMAFAMLLIFAASQCALDDAQPSLDPTPAPTEEAGTEAAVPEAVATEPAAIASPEVPPDPNNPATPAFLAITPEQWVNDPECKIADAVLAKASEENVRALADSGYYLADYVEACIAIYGLANFEQSNASAAYWLELPANKDIPQAMYFMGKLKESGAKKDGPFPAVSPDALIARSWYDKAAKAGNIEAAKALQAAAEAPAAQ